MDFQFSSVDWEQESYPHYHDLVVLPFFIIFFPLLRFVLDSLIFERLAKRLMFGKDKDNAKLKTSLKGKRINKFKESAWKTVYSLSAELLAIMVIYNEPWFTNTKYFWTGPGEDQVWPDHKMKLKLKLLYMYCGGFYIYAIFAVLFWDIRRSDFVALLAHHVGTVILIVLSYIFRCGRVGAVILALHEGSDVFLETAKISKYSGLQSLANSLFVMFALSWWILRLIYYPFWILRSTSYEVLTILGKDNKTTQETVLYFVFNSLLFGLLGLHLYWGKILVRMVITQIKAKGQIGDDARSDSEDEEKHQD
ncbi:OLC1v1014001C1 [Oldenlandia corymbosa var. corymbosa]|uniref:OLC1v1014001C1 n=1 Tax=Oldenlandia corymbosa var. corymbosa TaxID=529605 RepID=A0AAV1DZU5_OLDCO|nr:OLC1v1014001C1 [Oldenlandia corymbosa var. corymbosa]